MKGSLPRARANYRSVAAAPTLRRYNEGFSIAELSAEEAAEESAAQLVGDFASGLWMALPEL